MEMGKRWQLEGGEGREEGPGGGITKCDVYDGGAVTGDQLQNSKLGVWSTGLLSALLRIRCVVLGRSPNFSGPQPPLSGKRGLF